MRLTILAAMFAFMLWGSPAFAGTAGPDTDSDGIVDIADNCKIAKNPAQDDSDSDKCGNVCDADFNQLGNTNVTDFGLFGQKYGKTGAESFCIAIGHVVPGCTVNVSDFGRFGQLYLKAPGPSGTTPGTVACPL